MDFDFVKWLQDCYNITFGEFMQLLYDLKDAKDFLTDCDVMDSDVDEDDIEIARDGVERREAILDEIKISYIEQTGRSDWYEQLESLFAGINAILIF